MPFEFTDELAKGGRTFTYIPVSEVIDRLNKVLGLCAWDWRVVDRWTEDSFVMVEGVLTAHRMVAGYSTTAQYTGIGGQKINRNQQGQIVDLGDDWKGAASDALKKAAQHLGVGLYLARPGRAYIRDLEHAISSLDDAQRGMLKGRWATSDIPSLNRLTEDQAIFVYDLIEEVRQGAPEDPDRPGADGAGESDPQPPAPQEQPGTDAGSDTP